MLTNGAVGLPTASPRGCSTCMQEVPKCTVCGTEGSGPWGELSITEVRLVWMSGICQFCNIWTCLDAS